MRVLFLTSAVSWSGVEVHTIEWARALGQNGHDVAIVEFGKKLYHDAPQPLPCPVIPLDLGLDSAEEIPLDSLGFMEWKRRLSSLRADVAIVVKGTFKFGSLALEAACRFCFPSFLVIEHFHAPLGERPSMRLLEWPLPSLGLWWYRQWLDGRLRSVFPGKVICVSQALARTLKEDYGYPPPTLIVAHSGVYTEVFAPSRSLRDAARKAWGIPEDALVFGALGRLSSMKNHAQLINVFARLCESGHQNDVRLVIVGDGPLRSSLESLAVAKGVRQRVTFAGFSAEPQRLLQGFDVFCFPSTTGESLGIALLEAMSCGCPAIAAAVGGVPEILSATQFGWLIASGNENELFSAMQAAMHLGRESLLRMGARAREHIVRNFNAGDRWLELVKVVEAAHRCANGKPRAWLASK